MTYRSKIIKAILIICFSTIISALLIYMGIKLFAVTDSIFYKTLEVITMLLIAFIYWVVIDFQYYNIKWYKKRIENDKKNLVK
jgi:hypothetical protein